MNGSLSQRFKSPVPLSEFAFLGIVPVKDCGDIIIDKMMPFIQKKHIDR
jgi:hypothetical protein